MSKDLQTYSNEIDLIELLVMLWNGRLKIIATTFVTLLIGIALILILPKSYQVSTVIIGAKQSVFLPYTTLNELLKKNKFSFLINRDEIFRQFVSEFNDYKEILDILRKNEYVNKSLKDLDESDKQKKLIEFAKLFKLNQPNKDSNEWLLIFDWHDELQGAHILDDTIQQILINMQQNIKHDINELALSIETLQSFQLEDLLNELENLKLNRIAEKNKKILFLKEQSSIAKDLNIKFNENFDEGVSQIALNINALEVPYYLRGYKAIDKEITLIENRTTKEDLLMMDGYVDILKQITNIQSDLAAFQVRSALMTIETDNTNDWLRYNLELSDSENTRKPKMVVAISIALGGIVGSMFVLISNGISNRKKKMKEAK